MKISRRAKRIGIRVRNRVLEKLLKDRAKECDDLRKIIEDMVVTTKAWAYEHKAVEGDDGEQTAIIECSICNVQVWPNEEQHMPHCLVKVIENVAVRAYFAGKRGNDA